MLPSNIFSKKEKIDFEFNHTLRELIFDLQKLTL